MRVKLASSIWTHEINFGGSINWLVNRNAYQFYDVSTTLTNIYDPVAVPRPAVGTFAGGDIDDPFPITRPKLCSLFVSARSDTRRAGKGGASTCNSGWSPYQYKKK